MVIQGDYLSTDKYIPSNNDIKYVFLAASGWVSVAMDYTEWIPTNDGSVYP